MTSVSTLGQSLNQIDLIKQQNRLLTTLSTQMSTGKKTTVFSGLGTDVLTSKRARANFKSIETYQNNIDIADRRIRLMLNAINEFKQQAELLSSAIVGLSQQGAHQKNGDFVMWDDPLTTADDPIQVGVNTAEMDVEFRTLQDLATNLYDYMIDLLNAKETDRYLLNGADTLTKPLTDTGALDAKMTNLLTNWKDELSPNTISTDDLISALRSRTTAQNANAITDTIIGYSPALSAGNVGDIFIRVSESSEINYTALANDTSFRNILTGLSFMKNATLAPIADVFAEPYTLGDAPIVNGAPGDTIQEMKQNFYAVFNAVGQMVEEGINAVDTIVAQLEGDRARLNEIRIGYTEQKNALLTTISDVEDVDTNEVAVRLTALQVQLDASYRVTALLQDLSLANFLRI
jgi:flagellar hook-associated protein 3 FlgL